MRCMSCVSINKMRSMFHVSLCFNCLSFHWPCPIIASTPSPWSLDLGLWGLNSAVGISCLVTERKNRAPKPNAPGIMDVGAHRHSFEYGVPKVCNRRVCYAPPDAVEKKQTPS